MIAHTQGPWRVSDDAGGAVITDHPIEGGCNGSNDIEFYGGYLIAESVAPCNRPLIAAAPDMLAKLRELARECADCGGEPTDSGEPCPACADIRAVIAKAEGSAP